MVAWVVVAVVTLVIVAVLIMIARITAILVKSKPHIGNGNNTTTLAPPVLKRHRSENHLVIGHIFLQRKVSSLIEP